MKDQDFNEQLLRQDFFDSGLTQEQAAQKLGITSRALRNYLSGRRTPKRALAFAMAKLAGRKVRL